MSDTVKLPRPPLSRRGKQASGRVEHDSRGNAVWVRTRATDGKELAINAGLAIVDDPPKKSR
jgi:hypothetical protein